MRRAAILLLLIVAPFHALTGVYLDLRGSAHFHLHDEADDPDHGHPHPHGHGHVERHHHAVADPSVVTAGDDAALDAHALEEGVSTGWSATLCVALVSARAPWQVPRFGSGRVIGSEPLPRTRFPGRLERPPRPLT